MFVAGGVWCVAEVSSVRPSSEQTKYNEHTLPPTTGSTPPDARTRMHLANMLFEILVFKFSCSIRGKVSFHINQLVPWKRVLIDC